MSTRWIAVAALLAASCRQDPELRGWRDIVRRPTNGGSAGLQLGYCANPPRTASYEDRRHCAEVVGPAVVVLVWPELPQFDALHQSPRVCDWALDGLALMRRDDSRWSKWRDQIDERCCHWPGDGFKDRCARIKAADSR
jgi:hypothetical protein